VAQRDLQRYRRAAEYGQTCLLWVIGRHRVVADYVSFTPKLTVGTVGIYKYTPFCNGPDEVKSPL
jgi:hypothetical protein